MTGQEWIVDAYGFSASALRSVARMEEVFRRMVSELSLKSVAPAVWHEFPGEGGITGFLLLAESHLSCHTFPEYGAVCLNLFCCSPRRDWPFQDRLGEMLGADRVLVRFLRRDYSGGTTSSL
jgi:S-adenosylmethionine decarboxylase